MPFQLDFSSTFRKGTRTYHLDVRDGLGWREVADADSPEELLEEAKRQRAIGRSNPIVIRSRDPRHDSFVTGWAAGEAVEGLPGWTGQPRLSGQGTGL